ncbi:hypothetical protein R1flu_013193 [Riccia fluitans]|uniref:Uncharacterized protein n=1 Tax=Riccia fluitans TaxID=41844 RepID=A0ABD1XE78_9MARC
MNALSPVCATDQRLANLEPAIITKPGATLFAELPQSSHRPQIRDSPLDYWGKRRGVPRDSPCRRYNASRDSSVEEFQGVGGLGLTCGTYRHSGVSMINGDGVCRSDPPSLAPRNPGVEFVLETAQSSVLPTTVATKCCTAQVGNLWNKNPSLDLISSQRPWWRWGGEYRLAHCRSYKIRTSRGYLTEETLSAGRPAKQHSARQGESWLSEGTQHMDGPRISGTKRRPLEHRISCGAT